MTTKLPYLMLGLDLGDRLSSFCVLDRDRRVVESGEVAMTKQALGDLFARFPGAGLVFEVGAHSRWVRDVAERSSLSSYIVADPRQLALISRSHKKTDASDAEILARAGLGMPELLNAVEHRSERAQADLAVSRSRDKLVQARTMLVNNVRSMVKAHGSRITNVTATYFFSKAGAQIPVALRPAIEPLLEILKGIHEQIVELERRQKEIAKKYPQVGLLRTTPSVGLQTALGFVLTLEDPSRVRKTRDVGAYLGMTPRKKESGRSTPQLPITKAGDRSLRRLLVQCAHHLLARGKDCRLRRWGLELCRRGGQNARKRAVIAVARRLSVQLLAVWKSGQPYDPWYGMSSAEREALSPAA